MTNKINNLYVCLCVCVDLLDLPKETSRVVIPAPSSNNTRTPDMKFKQPSSANAVLTTSQSQPGTNAKSSTSHTSSKSSSVTHAQVVAKLSILKTPSEPNLNEMEDMIRENSVGGFVLPSSKKDDFRHRSKNALSNSQDISLARVKAMCVRTGSMDWGVSIIIIIIHSHSANAWLGRLV